MCDFSIIIPAYNEEELLPSVLQNLNSVLSELKPEFQGEIIVVDNNSSDKTAAIAEFYGAEVVFEADNCIAKARNRGASTASGKFFFFIDADTFPDTAVIKKALIMMASGKVCGGGAKVEFDIEKMPFFASLIVLWWECITFFIPLAAGSYIFCRADAWAETGGFFEKLYASEEVNFSYKLKKWGRKNKKTFKILPDRVKTSARKIRWFSPAKMFFFIMLNCLFPFLVRSRTLCAMWYKRPENR
jgi:glycosyltransferase involved in cell wall biosynthesis